MRAIVAILILSAVYALEWVNYTVTSLNTEYKEITGKSANLYQLIDTLHSYDQLVNGYNHHLLLLLNNTSTESLSMHFICVYSDFNETDIEITDHTVPEMTLDSKSDDIIANALSKSIKKPKAKLSNLTVYRQDIKFPSYGVGNMTEAINYTLYSSIATYQGNEYIVYASISKDSEKYYAWQTDNSSSKKFGSTLFPITITVIIAVVATFLALYAYVSRRAIPFEKQVDTDPRTLGVEKNIESDR
ncbi:unnamed protein product [Blepharisma stoltei]|uniref:Uncharacterized protein n=1 Tax=Blepharisma stoltei TaxID=1481888 RepID=A0AAU9IL17_9CILI|nr:unnamed protein product [Blepharisma stoltei]